MNLPRDNNGKLMRYAWPGGYPLYYLDGDNSVLCAYCASAHETDGIERFRPVDAGVNWEDKHMHCDECSRRIESAYCED